MSQDSEHLKLLSIFHYVVAAMAALFACIPFIHFFMGLAMATGTFPDTGPEVQPGDVRALMPRARAPRSEGPGYSEEDVRSLRDRLDDFEKTLITGALEAASGSVADAGRRLQTDRANLYRRMKRLGLRD